MMICLPAAETPESIRVMALDEFSHASSAAEGGAGDHAAASSQ
jgi:hypothetical protein